MRFRFPTANLPDEPRVNRQHSLAMWLLVVGWVVGAAAQGIRAFWSSAPTTVRDVLGRTAWMCGGAILIGLAVLARLFVKYREHT